MFPHCIFNPGTLSNPFLLCIPWEALVVDRSSSSALVQQFLDIVSYMPAHPNSTGMTTCDVEYGSKFSRLANDCSGVQTSLAEVVRNKGKKLEETALLFAEDKAGTSPSCAWASSYPGSPSS